MNKRPLVLSCIGSGLTILSVTLMIIVTGDMLSSQSRYSGFALWGLAWFPWLLIGALSITVELKDKTPIIQRTVFLFLPYLFLFINTVVQGKSFLLLATQAGLVESAGLLTAYAGSIVWILFKHKESISEFFIPQLFGIVFGGILLYIVGGILWNTEFIKLRDVLILIPSILIRSWSLLPAIRSQIAPDKTTD